MSLGPYLLILAFTVIHEDVACIGAGIASARGDVAWLPALIACLLGTLVMDVFYFCCGRYGGRWALKRRPLRWLIPERHLHHAITVLARYGSLAILIGRFLPGLRMPLQFGAGLAHARPARALLCFILACSIYVPVAFGTGYLFDEAVLEPLSRYQRYGIPIAIAVGLVIVLTAVAIRRRFDRLSFAADES